MTVPRHCFIPANGYSDNFGALDGIMPFDESGSECVERDCRLGQVFPGRLRVWKSYLFFILSFRACQSTSVSQPPPLMSS